MKWRTSLALAAACPLLMAQSNLSLNRGGDPSITRPVGSAEIERLRRDILEQTRSSVEAIGEYHSESGDLNNRLDFWRAGARLNYLWQPGTTFYVSGVRSRYMTTEDAFAGTGINLTAGMKSSFTENVDGQFEVGATRFTNTETSTVNALASVNYRMTDAASFFVTGSRSNVEDSLLSTTGLRPGTGPFAGQLVGRVMDNRLSGGLLYKLWHNLDLSGEGAWGMREGSNVDRNYFRFASAGLGYHVLPGSWSRHLSSLVAGYQFQYLDFDADRLGFGGASLSGPAGQPLPPGLIGASGPPSPAPGRPGVGGYFSPREFMGHVGRLDLDGRASNRFRYRASGFAGSQEYFGRARTEVYGFTGTLEWLLNDRYSIPVTFARDNYGPFTQQTLWVRLVVRM